MQKDDRSIGSSRSFRGRRRRCCARRSGSPRRRDLEGLQGRQERRLSGRRERGGLHGRAGALAEKPDEVRERVKRNESPTPDELEELRRHAQSGDEVEAARANFELTRAAMTQTVDALQDKLDPDQLKEQAKARATDTLRKGGSHTTETLKQNPAIPLAVGSGLLAVLLLRRLVGGPESVVVDLKRLRTRRG